MELGHRLNQNVSADSNGHMNAFYIFIYDVDDDTRITIKCFYYFYFNRLPYSIVPYEFKH